MTTLEPPASLNDDGRRIWRETLQQLLAAGTRSRIDPNSLLAYVAAVQNLNRATHLIGQTDILIRQDGKPVHNPLLELQRQASATIAQFSKQFKLNAAPVPVEQSRPEQPGRWCDQHGRWECIGKTKAGRQCHGSAATGKQRCDKHVGVKLDSDPEHLLALDRKKNPLAGEPLDISPIEAFLWRVSVLAGEVARLDEVCHELERDELIWGKTAETTEEGEDGQTRKTTYGARLSMWLIARSERERMLHAAAEAALKANVEERLVRIAEQEGAVIHKLMLAVLGDFGIEASDPRIPEVLPRRLRELPA